MRQGWTVVPAGLALVAALLGVGAASGAPPADGVSVTDERFGRPIAPIFLLLRPDVQADMELNRHQIDGAAALTDQLIPRLLAVRNKQGPAALTERREIDEKMREWLNHELAPAQLERLLQISFQWEGAWGILMRPTVREYLGVGEPQKARIRAILADRDRRHAAGQLTPAAFEQSCREAIGVLTPFQKQQWEGLLGPPCRFSIRAPSPPARVASADAGVRGRPAGR